MYSSISNLYIGDDEMSTVSRRHQNPTNEQKNRNAEQPIYGIGGPRQRRPGRSSNPTSIHGSRAASSGHNNNVEIMYGQSRGSSPTIYQPRPSPPRRPHQHYQHSRQDSSLPSVLCPPMTPGTMSNYGHYYAAPSWVMLNTGGRGLHNPDPELMNGSVEEWPQHRPKQPYGPYYEPSFTPTNIEPTSALYSPSPPTYLTTAGIGDTGEENLVITDFHDLPFEHPGFRDSETTTTANNNNNQKTMMYPSRQELIRKLIESSSRDRDNNDNNRGKGHEWNSGQQRNGSERNLASSSGPQLIKYRQWNSPERFVLDTLDEVYNKMPLLEKEIWGKLIVMEGKRRTAKAYLRHPTLIIDGTDVEFDGHRIGLSRFQNVERSDVVYDIFNEILDGLRLKIDRDGNVWARKMCPTPVFLSPLILSTGPGANNQSFLVDHKPVKVFDIQKFKDILVEELRQSNPDRAKLEKCCLVCIKLSIDHYDTLSTPLWLVVVHLVAVELINLVLPTKDQDHQDHSSSSPSSSFITSPPQIITRGGGFRVAESSSSTTYDFPSHSSSSGDSSTKNNINNRYYDHGSRGPPRLSLRRNIADGFGSSTTNASSPIDGMGPSPSLAAPAPSSGQYHRANRGGVVKRLMMQQRDHQNLLNNNTSAGPPHQYQMSSSSMPAENLNLRHIKHPPAPPDSLLTTAATGFIPVRLARAVDGEDSNHSSATRIMRLPPSGYRADYEMRFKQELKQQQQQQLLDNKSKNINIEGYHQHRHLLYNGSNWNDRARNGVGNNSSNRFGPGGQLQAARSLVDLSQPSPTNGNGMFEVARGGVMRIGDKKLSPKYGGNRKTAGGVFNMNKESNGGGSGFIQKLRRWKSQDSGIGSFGSK